MKLVLVKKEIVTKDGEKKKVNHFYVTSDNGLVKVQIEPKMFNNNGDKASWAKLRSLVEEIKEI